MSFRGTASYYARYRPGYPERLLERLAEAAGLDGHGRLLDLGCGTGLAYSSSIASLERLRDRREEFERELRSRLEPEYREVVTVDALLGRRSGA